MTRGVYVRCTGELARELQDQESRDEMVSRRGRTGVNEVRTTAEVFSMRFLRFARGKLQGSCEREAQQSARGALLVRCAIALFADTRLTKTCEQRAPCSLSRE